MNQNAITAEATRRFFHDAAFYAEVRAAVQFIEEDRWIEKREYLPDDLKSMALLAASCALVVRDLKSDLL